jgi:hypothetical protein
MIERNKIEIFIKAELKNFNLELAVNLNGREGVVFHSIFNS